MTTKTPAAKTEAAERAAVQDVRRHVQELLDQERAYSDRRRQTAADLARLRQAGGARLLSGEVTAEQAARDVAGLIADVEVCDMAITAARAQRAEAIAAVREARASAMEAEAARLEAEHEIRSAKLRELLGAVQEYEGVPYVPECDLLSARGGGAPGSPIVLVQPRTRALAAQAGQLRGDAVQLRRQPTLRSGMAEADGLEALVAAACWSDPERIGPAAAAVEAWAEPMIVAELARRSRLDERAPNYVPPARPVRLRLTWRDGAISPAESSAPTPMDAWRGRSYRVPRGQQGSLTPTLPRGYPDETEPTAAVASGEE